MRKIVLSVCAMAILAAAVVFGVYIVRSLPHGESFYEPIVAGQVYRSGQPHDADWAWMRQHLGIRTVVDLRGLDDDQVHSNRDEEAGVVGAGMKLVRIPMTKRGPNTEDVDRFLDAMADPANTPALIHCELGRLRSGVMVAVYRMEFLGWPNTQAVDEFLARLSHGDKHEAAEQFLRNYTRRRIPTTHPASQGSQGSRGDAG